MARPAEPCAQCQALVPEDQMATHLAWHNALINALSGHPHAPVAGSARSGKT